MRFRRSVAGTIPRGTVLGVRGQFKTGRLVVVQLALAATEAAAQGQGVVGTVPGRVGGSMAALVALVGVVCGGLAVRRTGRGDVASGGRDGAIVALVLGLVGTVLAVVHLATSTGGVGSGSGKAGAVVGAVLGLVGVLLGRTALARARRVAAA